MHPEHAQRYTTLARQLTGVRLLPATDTPDPRTPFLGRFAPDALLEELELFGVLQRLRARGYEQLLLELDDGTCPGRSAVRLWRADAAPSTRRARENLLMELVLWREHLEVTEAALAPPLAGLGPQPILTCEYLLLQDPDGTFDARRPRLPGQLLPGLRAGDQVLAAMLSWAARLGAGALMTLPDYFHSAVIFDRERGVLTARDAAASRRVRGFHVLDAELEGLLLAARRDLDVAGRGLAEASWHFEWGLVGLRRADGTVQRPWLWPSEPELVGLEGPLRAWLESSAYAERRDQAAAQNRFVLDREAAERRWPRLRAGADS